MSWFLNMFWFDSLRCFYKTNVGCVPHERNLLTGVYRQKDTFTGTEIYEI